MNFGYLAGDVNSLPYIAHLRLGYDEATVGNEETTLKTVCGYDISEEFTDFTRVENKMWQIGNFLGIGTFAEFLAAKTGTLELNTATTWGRAETLADHFARHGGDFAAKTADEYAGMASRFFQESQAAKLPTKIDSQGVIRVFDPNTGTFGSFNPNGTTRTLFKPSSPTYFDRQPGTLVP